MGGEPAPTKLVGRMTSTDETLEERDALSARINETFDSFDRWRERYRDAGLTAILVMQAAVMFLVGPMAGAGMIRPELVEILRIAMAAIAVLIVNRRRVVGLAVTLIFAVTLITHVRGGSPSLTVIMLINSVTIIVFDVGVAAIVAQAVFAPGRVSIHRIMGALILYLYIALIFASLYRLEAIFFQGAFQGVSQARHGFGDYLYFSMGALTTAGSGTIVATHPFARSLAMLEEAIGQLYPATFIARLVTLHGSVWETGRSRGR